MNCKLCNNLLLEYDKYFLCSNCKLIHKKYIPLKIEEKERYLNHIYDDNYKEYMKKLTSIINFKNKEVLDYGCGRHPILQELYKDCNITNYDYYFYNDKIYLNKKYDLILVIEVIEHISDIKTTIEELLSLLNDGGMIYIHTKLYDDNTDFNKWWYFRDITHISFFSKDTFLYIKNKYKLNIEFLDDYVIIKKN